MFQEILAIVIILSTILIGCGCLYRPYWRLGPRLAYHRTVKQFGRPSFLNHNSNGVAVWKIFKDSCPFTRIMIVDENVPHDKPMEHCDYFYGTIKYSIDTEMRLAVYDISKSVMYDSLKEELTVRCQSLEAVMATMILVDKVNKKLVTHGEVLDGHKYKEYIKAAGADAFSNYRVLQSLKDDYELKKIDMNRCNA